MEYAIIYSPGPAWIAGRPASQQALGPHHAYLRKLAGAHKLLQVSHSGDGNTWVAVFEVESEAEARQLLTIDPAVGAKIVNAELRLWHIVFGLTAGASLPRPV
ncbi:MAG: YciI family protein [Streptosporangiaceae bacterium]